MPQRTKKDKSGSKKSCGASGTRLLHFQIPLLAIFLLQEICCLAGLNMRIVKTHHSYNMLLELIMFLTSLLKIITLTVHSRTSVSSGTNQAVAACERLAFLRSKRSTKRREISLCDLTVPFERWAAAVLHPACKSERVASQSILSTSMNFLFNYIPELSQPYLSKNLHLRAGAPTLTLVPRSSEFLKFE